MATRYMLTVSPESIGMTVAPEWWENLRKNKAEFEASTSIQSLWRDIGRKNGSLVAMQKSNEEVQKNHWRKFSGLDS